MSQSTISLSSCLFLNEPSRVTAKDIAEAVPLGYTASRQSKTTSNDNASITIETVEGDKVTLNYQTSTTRKNYLREVGTEIPGLEKSLETHKDLTVSIEGDLSEQEMLDIKSFKEEVSAILDNFISMNSKNNNDQIKFDISKYQSLSKYAMAIDSSSSTAWATEMVVAIARPVQNDIEFATQQKANLTSINNELNVINVSKDLEIKKQNSSLEFDYSVSRMNQQSIQIEAQRLPSFTRNKIVVQQETYDKQGNAPQNSKVHLQKAMNLPDIIELRQATQEMFSQHTFLLKSTSSIQGINTLEKDFLYLIDQLAARTEKTEEQNHTVMICV